MKIRLNDMIFYGYHGVHKEERTLGQRFIVDCHLKTDNSLDDEIKHLKDTVDYTKVFIIIKSILETEQFELLEICARTIVDSILTHFEKIIYVKITIKKPNVPINGNLSSVEVEMEKHR